MPAIHLDTRVFQWYTLGMKTAVSIPDPLFASADELADTLGVSRSELYARALADYVARHRTADLTARLDAVYANEPARIHPAERRAQRRAIERADPDNQW